MGPIYLGKYFALSECLSESESRYIDNLSVRTGFIIFSYNIRLDTGDDEAGDEVTFNNVRHSLPTQKKSNKKKHSFTADVKSNQPVSNK